MSQDRTRDEDGQVETPARERGVRPEPPPTGTVAGRAPASPPPKDGLDEASPGAADDRRQAQDKGAP